MEPYNTMAGFEPLKILQREPSLYVKWHCDLRCEPLGQLEYKMPVIKKCDYEISNQGAQQGPAADHAQNGGPECEMV